MTELEQLQKQIEELQKTVNDLKSGTVRVETNYMKLARLKDEIIKTVIPPKALNTNPNRLSRFKQNKGIVANEIFFMKTSYKDEAYKKMVEIIFGHDDSDERLKLYLGIYREVCEFMAVQYKKLFDDLESEE